MGIKLPNLCSQEEEEEEEEEFFNSTSKCNFVRGITCWTRKQKVLGSNPNRARIRHCLQF